MATKTITLTAYDFETAGGQSLSTAGGSVTGVNGSQTKALTNNTINNLFTLPLAVGEIELIELTLNVVAKKGADWAIAAVVGYILLYNDGTTLQKTLDTSIADNSNSVGAVSLAAFSNITPVDASLSAGVVTITINPGNVGTTPDSIVINYVAINPSGKTLTYL